MSVEFITERFSPPKRVEILKAQEYGNWAPGQFGYARFYTTRPLVTVDKGPTTVGELAYGVTKRKHAASVSFSRRMLCGSHSHRVTCSQVYLTTNALPWICFFTATAT